MSIRDEVLLNRGSALTEVIAKIWLISNVFIWYFCIFFLFKNIINEIKQDPLVDILIWFANFSGAIASAIISSTLINNYKKRVRILKIWILLGVFSSFLILLCEEGFLMNLVISVFLGISFGMGLPVCMGYYTDTTPVEKRGKIAGLTLLASYMGSFAFFIITTYLGLDANVIILAIFRSLSLLIIPFINKSLEIATIGRMRIPKYLEIFRQRAFIFYFIPWLMFSLVNYLSLPVQLMILSENVGNILILIENVLIGVFAVIGGFVSDSFGRKRLAIVGFLLLGIGYGVLGISSTNLFSWYIYTVIDGVAWGILQATMLFVIWGDLAQGAFSERYYALGGLPYIFSSFLRITLGPYIAVTVPSYAIFSFVAFFLFLAVFPLTLAPETLPEKKLKERELKRYIEEAKRVREKFTKG